MEAYALHHVAIICTDREKALIFYRDKLGFAQERAVERPERGDSMYMLRRGNVVLELFIRPNAPARVTDPEALGLRHLAFYVPDIEMAVRELHDLDIETEPIREDLINGGRMTFFRDPDGLPLELHE